MNLKEHTDLITISCVLIKWSHDIISFYVINKILDILRYAFTQPAILGQQSFLEAVTVLL